MAVIQLYNHTVNRFNEGLNGEGDTYKVMLLNNDAVFDATDTTLVEVAGAGSPAANEVSGNGWDVGGEALASVVIAIYSTNGGKFDAADLNIAISGGDLGPIYKFVLYNDTDADDPPVLFGTLTTATTVISGNNAGIGWPANGIILWTVS
jgi:hypothetical protein